MIKHGMVRPMSGVDVEEQLLQLGSDLLPLPLERGIVRLLQRPQFHLLLGARSEQRGHRTRCRVPRLEGWVCRRQR